jgi:hypothetical protein
MMHRQYALAALLTLAIIPWVVGQTEPEPSAEKVRRVVEAFLDDVRRQDDTAGCRSGQAVLELGPAAIPSLVAGLDTRTSREIVWILRTLKTIGGEEAAATTSRFVRHADAEVRAEAITTLSRLLGPVGLPLYLVAAEDPDSAVRRRAFDALCMVPDAALTLDAALLGIVDSDFWVRARSVRILRCAPPPPALGPDPLIKGLLAALPALRKDEAIPLFALLSSSRRPGLEEVIEQALGRGSRDAAAAALDTAAGLGLRGFVKTALEMARSDEATLALPALRYLARLRERGAISTLVGRIPSVGDSNVKNAIDVSLRQITGQTFGYDVSQWRRWMAQEGL